MTVFPAAWWTEVLISGMTCSGPPTHRRARQCFVLAVRLPSSAIPWRAAGSVRILILNSRLSLLLCLVAVLDVSV